MALIRQTILYLPAQVIAPAMQFASVLLWAALLTPAHLGLVTMLAATQEICYAAFFGWWALYSLRFIGSFSGGEERRAFIRTETLAIVGSLAVETMLVVPVLLLLDSQTPLNGWSMALAIAFISTRSLNQLASDRARAERRILLYSLIQIIGPVAGFGIGYLFMLRFGHTAQAVLGGFVLAQGFGVLLSITMSDLFHHIGRASSATLKEAGRFGGTQATSQMLAIVAMNAPRFIVLSMLGISAAGMFAVGYSLGLRASSFAVTLVTAGAYPLVVRKMQQEGAEAAFTQLSRNMVLVALVVAPVAFGLMAVSRSVTELLVASQFRTVTYAVLPMATLGGLLRYLRAHTSDQVFLLYLKPQFGTIIAICDLVVAVLSAWVGVAILGTTGGALGPMISGAVTFMLSFALARLVFGYKAPFSAFFRIAATALIMAAAVFVLPVAPNLFTLVLYAALGGIIYAGGLLLLMPAERRMMADMLFSKLAHRRAGSST